MIAIVTDSTAYLTKYQAQKMGVSIVPVTYNVNGQIYNESYSDQNGAYEQLLLRNPQTCHTAHASVAAFMSTFSEHLRRGHQVFCLVLSSRLSGTYSSAAIAAREMGSTDILVVDSLTTAGGLTLLLEKTRELIDQELPLDQLALHIEQLRSHIGIAFSVDNMDALRRSGRLGTVRQSVGTILNVRPILLCRDGAVISDGQARGKVAQAAALTDRIPANAKNLILHYFGNISSLDTLRTEIKRRLPNVPVGYCRCGPVLSVHLGLETIGVAWML